MIRLFFIMIISSKRDCKKELRSSSWPSATNYFKTQTMSRFSFSFLFFLMIFMCVVHVYISQYHLGIWRSNRVKIHIYKCIIETRSKCQIHNTFCVSSRLLKDEKFLLSSHIRILFKFKWKTGLIAHDARHSFLVICSAREMSLMNWGSWVILIV